MDYFIWVLVSSDTGALGAWLFRKKHVPKQGAGRPVSGSEQQADQASAEGGLRDVPTHPNPRWRYMLFHTQPVLDIARVVKHLADRRTLAVAGTNCGRIVGLNVPATPA